MQSSLRILFSLSAESLVGCLELFCTSLCAIYDAYQEHSSTLNWLIPWGMLWHAHEAQGSSSKCASTLQSVSWTNLDVCLQLLILFGSVIHWETEMWLCCSGTLLVQVSSVLLLSPNTRVFYVHASKHFGPNRNSSLCRVYSNTVTREDFWNQALTKCCAGTLEPRTAVSNIENV